MIKECELIGDTLEIIQGIKNGFHQGIPEHHIPGHSWFTPDNHSSALACKTEIENNLRAERDAGRIYGPFTPEEVFKHWGFFRSNPMGSVVNNDGSSRMINDLSYPRDDETTPSVNSFVDKHEFDTSWDDFNSVAEYLESKQGINILLAIFDWKKAYRQVATEYNQWKYLTIKDFDGLIWIDTRVAFGGVGGCGTFGKVADVWRKIVQRLLGIKKTFRWVDDCMITKEEGENIRMQDVLQLSRDMGVVSNEKKLCDFKPEQKYLGFVWNGFEKTVRLPEDKLKERKELIENLLTQDKRWSKNEVEKAIGKINHLTYLLPNLKCHMRYLYAWLKSWRNPNATRLITADATDDLKMWREALNVFQNRLMIPKAETEKVGWFGDASTGFGIGILIGRNWAYFRLKENWKRRGLKDTETSRGIAWAETTSVRLGLLMLEKLKRVRGRRFELFTDNTTTKSALLNQKSRDESVNNEYKKIQLELTRLQCDIDVQWISTKVNLADKLSRGETQEHHDADRVHITIPIDLISLLESA